MFRLCSVDIWGCLLLDRISYKKDGSFTIELSLIMPIIVAVFLMVIFCMYYVHDRVIIEKTCYISALRGALCVVDSDKEYVAKREFDKEIEKRLLCKWDYETNVEKLSEIVSVRFYGVMQMREGLLAKIIGKRLFVFSTECESDEAYETLYLRTNCKG